MKFISMKHLIIVIIVGLIAVGIICCSDTKKVTIKVDNTTYECEKK